MISNRIFRDNDTWFGITNDKEEWRLLKYSSLGFYHFFYGLFLPLLNLFRQDVFSLDQRVYLLSQRHFDRYLNEIVSSKIGNLIVLDSLESIKIIQRNGRHISYFVIDSLEIFFHRLDRFSIRPTALDNVVLSSIREFGVTKFSQPMIEITDIVIIDRQLGTDEHGGNLRRIPNVDAIVEFIVKHGYSVKKVFLEETSMAYQIAIFRSARIIIAQHGAALGHLIWMQPGKSGVIEIVPRQFLREGWQYFDLLAAALNIDRVEIVQNERFSPVDPKDILSGIQQFEILLR
jgi:hypothetical protein